MRIIRNAILWATGALCFWLLERHYFGAGANWKQDEGAMTSGCISILGWIYGVMAALILGTVWTQWSAIQDAADDGDGTKFWKLANRRIPTPVKSMLIIASLFLWGSLLLIDFKSMMTGGFAITAVAFMLAMIWEVIIDLDSPLDGVWMISNPPPREENVPKK